MKNPAISKPTFDIETDYMQQGYKVIAGVDEVGRGPLAGPVVAAAVVLDAQHIPKGLNDSKKLSERRRDALFNEICDHAHVSIVSLPAPEIDQLNIRGATLSAMVKAIAALNVQVDFALIDGRDIPAALTIPAQAVIKGDGKSVSIAAASIVAKVTRDRMMKAADMIYEGYGFASHKGYGSKKHRDAIGDLGPCPLHRRSFEPIRSLTNWQSGK